MHQRLTIYKFGPLTEVELELKDILIFIGSQASGKSTVSKAIFFFKSLRDDLTSYLYQCYEQKQFIDRGDEWTSGKTDDCLLVKQLLVPTRGEN